MFQYAAGFSLALKIGQPHFLDVSDFKDYRLHQGFELDKVFTITSSLADPKQVSALVGWRSRGLAKRVLRRPTFERFRGGNFLVEPHFNYWSGLSELGGDKYLTGYWQSERYFIEQKDAIQTEFTFINPLVGANVKIANAISNTTSVSVHVRRGDYLSNPQNHSLMHVADLAYYRSAILYMASKIIEPVFYVFSDDIIWARENINFGRPCIYISHNSKADSFIDMQLMSMCQHHIIANSTFSWWGAWLNPCIKKIVIAPKLWFRNDTPDHDLIPRHWIRI